jgi:hypothetical protein
MWICWIILDKIGHLSCSICRCILQCLVHPKQVYYSWNTHDTRHWQLPLYIRDGWQGWIKIILISYKERSNCFTSYTASENKIKTCIIGWSKSWNFPCCWIYYLGRQIWWVVCNWRHFHHPDISIRYRLTIFIGSVFHIFPRYHHYLVFWHC